LQRRANDTPFHFSRPQGLAGDKDFKKRLKALILVVLCVFEKRHTKRFDNKENYTS